MSFKSTLSQTLYVKKIYNIMENLAPCTKKRDDFKIVKCFGIFFACY